MKKLYSTIMLLALMVSALGFTACSRDSDGDRGGSGSDSKSLVVDGDYYYATDCTVEQTSNYGMYFNIHAATSSEFALSGHELVIHVSPNTVADLKVGNTFDSKSMTVQTFRGITQLEVNTYQWRILSGSITIKKITDMELTLQIDNMELQHKVNSVKHTISGTAILDSGTYQDNRLLPFSEAVTDW